MEPQRCEAVRLMGGNACVHEELRSFFFFLNKKQYFKGSQREHVFGCVVLLVGGLELVRSVSVSFVSFSFFPPSEVFLAGFSVGYFCHRGGSRASDPRSLVVCSGWHCPV